MADQVAPDPISVVFPIFASVTQLDFTGPLQVLDRKPEISVIVASVGGVAIHAHGLAFAGLAKLEDVASCDVLCVPGGGGVAQAVKDDAFMRHIRRLGLQARYVTSVRTGSLILGAAGLLDGKRAASHWASRDLLSLFGAIPDPSRVVRDGNVITGGGVTAGIDFGLTLLAELTDDMTAQAAQLGLEYAPAPPFESGRPDIAPPAVLQRVMERGAGSKQPDDGGRRDARLSGRVQGQRAILRRYAPGRCYSQQRACSMGTSRRVTGPIWTSCAHWAPMRWKAA